MNHIAASKKDSDEFQQLVKRMCKINNLQTRKLTFETIENVVVISLKNHLKDGIDLDCFHILNVIYQIITPLGVKFNQQLYLYPNSNSVARVTVTFEKEEYDAIIEKMKGSNQDG